MSKAKKEPWYLGGMASIGAVMITHPLDTIKVQLQTQQKVKFGFFGMTVNIVKTTGFFSLYNGLSAAILRQATYSTTRFGCYEVFKGMAEVRLSKESPKGSGPVQLPFYQKILI
ncbi:unnamed protein product, partial [Sphagnum balticum]